MASHPRALPVALVALSGLVLSGCSLGSDVPDADAVIEMTTYLEEQSEEDDLLVAPTVGVGTRTLPGFQAEEGYRWNIRCLSDEMPGVSAADPEAVAAGAVSEEQLVVEQDSMDRPCAGGESSGGSSSTGGPVEVTITAGPETYWVAAVYEWSRDTSADDGTDVDGEDATS